MRRIKFVSGILACILLIAPAGILYVTKNEAHNLITAPMETRNLPEETPADYSLPYEDVEIKSPDGLKLAGWFVPSQNGAVMSLPPFVLV